MITDNLCRLPVFQITASPSARSRQIWRRTRNFLRKILQFYVYELRFTAGGGFFFHWVLNTEVTKMSWFFFFFKSPTLMPDIYVTLEYMYLFQVLALNSAKPSAGCLMTKETLLILLMLETEYFSLFDQCHTCWCPGSLSCQNIRQNISAYLINTIILLMPWLLKLPEH